MVRIASIALSLCLASLGSADSSAAETLTPNTLRSVQGEPPPPATIDEMAWYAGAWRGTGLSGDNEEIWSAPKNGTMMGMYRLLEDGRPVFYEFLLLTEEHNSLTLRIKHFHPDLRGWEERDESSRLALVAKRGARFYFDGLTFERDGNGMVTIYLAIQPRNGPIREEVFRYQRDPGPFAH